MNDDEVAGIVQKIMAEHEVDRLDGFGLLTIRKLAALLNQAVRAGEANAKGPF